MAKMTLTEKFSHVKNYLETGAISEKMSVQDMIAFCDERMSQIAKKSTKGQKSDVAIENEKIAQDVYAFLVDKNDFISQKDIRIACKLSSPQKATMIMKILVENAQVEKTEIKGAPHFKAIIG